MAREKKPSALRRGWTTGACAAAAAGAAYTALLTGRFPDPVGLRLPNGMRPRFALARAELEAGRASAGIVKDAGDDPDVTHGALVIAMVEPARSGAGVTFAAGEGVGRVTLPGLPLAVGEPAINPRPRAMIASAVAAAAARHGGPGDAHVTVSMPEGERLAGKTANPRLGIIGGLSILGTTGVVIPYSCASWVHSIHSAIDVARATGLTHVAAATGRTSEAAVARLHDLPALALIEMGDFAGATLKYVGRRPVPRLTIAGGFAKIAKLAAGHLDLRAVKSTVDIAALASLLGALGAPPDAVRAARQSASAGAVLAIAEEAGAPLGDAIARRARETARAALSGATAVDVAVFDRHGRLVGRCGP